MKSKLYSPVIGTMLGLAILATPVGAQSTDLNNPGVQNNQSQPGTNTTTNQAEENQGFDWRWLLPLAAIPIILPFLLRRDRTDEDRVTNRRSQVAYHDVDKRRKEEDDDLI